MANFRKLLPLVFLLLAGQVQAKLSIEITQGQEGAMPIAIVPFGWEGPGVPSQDIAAIIGADLHRSGRFAPLSPQRLVGQPHHSAEVNFGAWRGSGSEHLVVGRLRAVQGHYVVEFQLLDVLRGEQLYGGSIPATEQALRSAAHRIADVVYEKLTSQKGAFDTEIAYVTVDQGADGKRIFKLVVADADGYNDKGILTSPQPLMSPAWSPDGERIAYVSFEKGRPEIYVQEVTTGARRAVASYQGINSAPSWSPDGKRLALTLSRDGNPEIYVLRLDNKQLTRVTNSYAIDTEAVWSPDGRSIVFTSDRGGRPQLYRVEANGERFGRPRRLSFEGDYNSRPAFSPDGRYLAMVHQVQGAFRIGLMDLENNTLRVLSDTGLDESPSFAPNGSMIIYATEARGRGVLGAVSVEGSARQRLGHQGGDVREPAWSPILKNGRIR